MKEYYESQLSRITTDGEFCPTFKVFSAFSGEQDTHHIDLNPTSAAVLVEWLTDNYIEKGI